MAGSAPLDQGRSERPAAGLERGLREARGTGPAHYLPPPRCSVLSGGRQRSDVQVYLSENGEVAFCRLSDPGFFPVRDARLSAVTEMWLKATERQDELAAIGEVLRGNKEAFRLIVERYKGLIVRLSASFLGNREEAEEAAQEIFLRAYRSLHRFSLDRKLLPWLYSIALNHLRSAYGRMRKREERTAAAEMELAAGGEADPQRLALEDYERSALRKAVDSLPPTLREVIVLYYYEEMHVETIGTILNIGTENVKSRLFRGRQKLRETLQKGTTFDVH